MIKADVEFKDKQILRQIERGIDKGIKYLTPKIVKYAQNNHRYNDQTGTLTNSTYAYQVENGLNLTANQLYGIYIHEGFKTWSPDEWLLDAIENNMDLIVNTLNRFISKELK